MQLTRKGGGGEGKEVWCYIERSVNYSHRCMSSQGMNCGPMSAKFRVPLYRGAQHYSAP